MADDRLHFVKRVKEASDIVSVIGSYLALQQIGKDYRGLCPFHGDSRPSLQVSTQYQNFRCWACNKRGDVITFVQEFEKIDFPAAVESLAQRAGIAVPKSSSEDARRAAMFSALRWAAELYHNCLIDSPAGEPARLYLGGRKITGETSRRWQLGFAPNSSDWLLRQAADAGMSLDILVQVGLIGVNDRGPSRYYDRFRERVMFPIRDVRGQVVGFGGRILPESPYSDRIAKYLNTSETELFKKSELIYGLDIARLAGQSTGVLAVVEGYTDVLMAHQMGVSNVVATMGTALTPQHVRQLRRYAPKVTLVYDADAGGSTGVDRALELFIREEADLVVAQLPEGLDPYDLLVQQGVQPFQSALDSARDALDFKIDQLLTKSAGGLEANRRSADAVLGILALVPEGASSSVTMKADLVLNRLGRRFGLREETLRTRLGELRQQAQAKRAVNPQVDSAEEVPERGAKAAGPADPLERELIEVLLAAPNLVRNARAEIESASIRHPGLRRLLEAMYATLAEGVDPDVDALRLKLMDNPRLIDFALKALDVGQTHPDKPGWLEQVLEAFRERKRVESTRSLKSQLTAASDDAAAMDLLRKLQQRASQPSDGLSPEAG